MTQKRDGRKDERARESALRSRLSSKKLLQQRGDFGQRLVELRGVAAACLR